MASIEFQKCPICVEKRRTNTWVCCPKCSFSCCRGCIKQYLLNIPDIIPKCMKCSSQWTLDFVSENTEESFHNKTYRNYRTHILLEREKSLLSQSQVYAEKALSANRMKKEITDLDSRIKILKREIDILHDQKSYLTTQCVYIQRGKYEELVNMVSKEEKERVFKTVCKCPFRDCKGFITTANYKCGLCNKKICKDCHKNEDGEHKCKVEDIETIKLLKNDTKCCPKCAVPIFKTDGCDQMFCTHCKTAFSWKTGQIETGVVHNPHYYQWLRENGQLDRNAGDVRCGGAVELISIVYHLRNMGATREVNTSVDIIHRGITHNRYTVLPIYERSNRQYSEEDYRTLRVQYLINDIDEQKWFSLIKKKEKQREKNRENYMVISMFVDTADILLANILTKNNIEEVYCILDQFESLKDYTNKQMSKIGKSFGNSYLQITKAWIIK